MQANCEKKAKDNQLLCWIINLFFFFNQLLSWFGKVSKLLVRKVSKWWSYEGNFEEVDRGKSGS